MYEDDMYSMCDPGMYEDSTKPPNPGPSSASAPKSGQSSPPPPASSASASPSQQPDVLPSSPGMSMPQGLAIVGCLIVAAIWANSMMED